MLFFQEKMTQNAWYGLLILWGPCEQKIQITYSWVSQVHVTYAYLVLHTIFIKNRLFYMLKFKLFILL